MDLNMELELQKYKLQGADLNPGARFFWLVVLFHSAMFDPQYFH